MTMMPRDVLESALTVSNNIDAMRKEVEKNGKGEPMPLSLALAHINFRIAALTFLSTDENEFNAEPHIAYIKWLRNSVKLSIIYDILKELKEDSK